MKLSQRPEISRPLAPQPPVRSVVIDNQIAMLCHDRCLSLAFTKFPRAGLAHCSLNCQKRGVGIPASARRTATLWTQIERRLGKVEARRNEPPDTAKATKAL